MGKLTPIQAFTKAAERSKKYTGSIDIEETPNIIKFETGTEENTLLARLDSEGYIEPGTRFNKNDDHNVGEVTVYGRECMLFAVCATYSGMTDTAFDINTVENLKIKSLTVELSDLFVYDTPEYFFVGNDQICYDSYYYNDDQPHHIIPISDFNVVNKGTTTEYTLRAPLTIPASEFAPTYYTGDPSVWSYVNYLGIGAFFGDDRHDITIKNATIELELNAGYVAKMVFDGEIKECLDYLGATADIIDDTISSIVDYVDEKLLL